MTFPSGRRAARFTSPEAVQRATYFPLAPPWRCSARRCQRSGTEQSLNRQVAWAGTDRFERCIFTFWF